MTGTIFTSIIFFIVGIGIIWASIMLLKKYNKIALRGRKTKGKVINYKEEISEDSDGFNTKYYYPIIEFKNETQDVKTKTLDFGTTRKRFKINSTLSITYLKEKDEYQIILNNKNQKLIYNGMLVFGSLFILIAIGILIKEFYY